MPSFSYFKRHSVDDSTTAIYTFENLPGKPQLICAPATIENAGFLNEKARIVAEKGVTPEKPAAKKDESEAAKAAERLASRLRTAGIVARSCVRGFARAPIDDDGKDLDYSTDNARLWLEGMATDCAWQFNAFCGWLVEGANFMPVSQPELEQIAKN